MKKPPIRVVKFLARPAGLPRSAQNCAGCGAFVNTQTSLMLVFVYSLSNKFSSGGVKIKSG